MIVSLSLEALCRQLITETQQGEGKSRHDRTDPEREGGNQKKIDLESQ